MTKDGEIPEKDTVGTREGALGCAAAPDRGARARGSSRGAAGRSGRRGSVVPADVGRGTARGMQVKFQAANEVTRVAYLEDPREPRLLFEFIEMNEVMRAGFAARLEAARTWQGENPLQVIDLGG